MSSTGNGDTGDRAMEMPEIDSLETNGYGRCASCAAPLAHDQRYCVSCGTRRGPLPELVDAVLRDLRSERDPASALLAAAGHDGEPGETDEMAQTPPPWRVPTARAASLAVMAMMSFGVIAGSLTTPGGAEGLARTLVVAVAPPAASAPSVAADASAGGDSGGGSGGSAAITETITESASTPAGSAAPAVADSGSAPDTGTTPDSGTSTGLVSLPPIKHVFLIMLSDQGYDQSFAVPEGHPYLASTLRRQGELLTDYYGVAPSPLANEIALISGQGPTSQTVQDCPQFLPISPSTVGAQSQVQGAGCVYPKQTSTLPDELVGDRLNWRAYIQGSEDAAAGQPATCRHPAIDTDDPDTAARAGDPYVTWKNPFVYFDSIDSSSLCATNDVGLPQLAKDLKQASTTPALSYIAPDPCDDGSDQPCTPQAPAGLAQSDKFLKSVVPEIEKSAAYKQDGMIVITFDEAPQSGADADNNSCCDQPAFPNLTGASAPERRMDDSAPGSSTTSTGSDTTSAGDTTAGSDTTADSDTTTSQSLTVSTPLTNVTVPTPLPDTTGDTTAAPTTTGDPAPAAPAGTSSTTPPTTTTAPSTCVTTTGATTTGTSTSTTTPTTTTTTSAGAGATCTPAGGGQVGALLISRYVKAGSEDGADTFNHFSLLKTVEDLFSVKRLGYAADASVPEFDASVFNNFGQQ